MPENLAGLSGRRAFKFLQGKPSPSAYTTWRRLRVEGETQRLDHEKKPDLQKLYGNVSEGRTGDHHDVGVFFTGSPDQEEYETGNQKGGKNKADPGWHFRCDGG